MEAGVSGQLYSHGHVVRILGVDLERGTTANFEALKAHILPMSRASTFDAARREWEFFHAEYHGDFDNCPLWPRHQGALLLRNRVTRRQTYVGNVCVRRFMGIETGALFDGIRRIAKDPTANANEDLIEHAYRLGYIYEKEYKFLIETKRKRKLSEKQLAWKEKINWRILSKTIVRKG